MNLKFSQPILLAAVTSPLMFSQCATGGDAEPMNILFIAIDDLRPELGAFGQSHIISPNIDALAESGTVFQKSYCNFPVSGASRASFMTGLYATPTRFTTYMSRIEEDAPGIPSIAETFKNNGVNTYSIGKIIHHPDDGLAGWSELPFRPDYPNDLAVQENWRDYQSPELAHLKSQNLPGGGAGPAWESPDVEDDAYCDGKTATAAVAKIKALGKSGEQFFLGVGFVKPHLPFNAPKRYWDMYDSSKIELASNPNRPEGVTNEAFHSWGELKTYTNIDKKIKRVEDDQARELRHAYYAAISYIDAQVGRVLTALDEAGLAENTVVVLVGDHGWSLGEHNMWCKTSNFDNVMRVPLIMRAPQYKGGAKTTSLASYVDLYPTLCDLANVPTPEHAQGKSLRPILNDPTATVNDFVFCRWKNGEAIIADDYNFTEYTLDNGEVEEMMYDHKYDPDENHNVAYDKEYQSVVEGLRGELHKHLQWRK